MKLAFMLPTKIAIERESQAQGVREFCVYLCKYRISITTSFVDIFLNCKRETKVYTSIKLGIIVYESLWAQ